MLARRFDLQLATPLPFAASFASRPAFEIQERNSNLNIQRRYLLHHHHRPRTSLAPSTQPTKNARLYTYTTYNSMVSFKAALLVAAAVMHAQAQDFSDLVGTWSSKSNSTFTGPVRYLQDPVYIAQS